MITMNKKIETRIIPEETNPKFYSEHLKPYELVRGYAGNKNILEVGCGDGYGAEYLAKVAKEIVAIDYEEDVIKKSQLKYIAKNLKFLCMGATKLEFPDDVFDIVCSFQVIEHIPENELLNYLHEIKRVLKPGGRFYVSTLNLAHNMKNPDTYKKHPAHCKEFFFDELKSLLSKVFFDISVFGLHLTLKHRFFQRLKKIGIFNFLPDKMNPVKIFYNKVTTADFLITADNIDKAIDFICICKK